MAADKNVRRAELLAKKAALQDRLTMLATKAGRIAEKTEQAKKKLEAVDRELVSLGPDKSDKK